MRASVAQFPLDILRLSRWLGGRHGENLVDFLHPGLEDGLYCLGTFMDIEGVDAHDFLDGEDFLTPVLDGV